MNPVVARPPAFEPFPKIGRLKREMIVTEKIDGTNAQVLITADGDIFAGSRKRWITPGKTTDNYGFAGWVHENRRELLKLGPGRHFGEWWGAGIQRGYDMPDKRFSLFNVARYFDADPDEFPACCSLVPLMARCEFSSSMIDMALDALREAGSLAAPGFMHPEGIVVYHAQSRQSFKVTLQGDDHGKSFDPSEVSA
jgi:hypothetical protein